MTTPTTKTPVTEQHPSPDQGDLDPGQVNVLLLESIHDAGEQLLREEGFTIRRIPGSLSSDELADAVSDVHLLGIRSKTHISEDVLAHAGNLLAIGCFCIGTNQVDIRDAGRRGVAVFNAPFSSTRSVAELTLAEIIALHRRMPEKSAKLHRGIWDKSASGSHEVRGRTLGIVGYGHIGSQLSVLAESVGMRVIYYDIATKLPLGNAQPMETLEQLLRRSDIVSLHVPATPLTDSMIGLSELKQMKAGAYLINNSRGSVVDLDALCEALRSGHIGGAAVDVYPDEPRSNDEPFECPLAGQHNVILTPHIGGSTEQAQESIAVEVASKLARFITNGSTSTSVSVPEVDLPKLRADQHRILHFHRNVPGVLSKMHRLLADLEVNINAEYLQSNPEISYVILDIDPTHREEVVKGLAAIEETIRVRSIL